MAYRAIKDPQTGRTLCEYDPKYHMLRVSFRHWGEKRWAEVALPRMERRDALEGKGNAPANAPGEGCVDSPELCYNHPKSVT